MTADHGTPLDPAAPQGPTPGDAATTPVRGEAERAVFRTALRDMLVFLGVLAVLGIGIGALVAGLPGVWGALIGVGLALIFSGTTVLSMMRTSGATPARMAGVVMGAWLGKFVVLIVVLAVLRGQDFYSRVVLAVVLVVGVVGSAFLDLRAVQRGRVPYVSPASDDSPRG